MSNKHNIIYNPHKDLDSNIAVILLEMFFKQKNATFFIATKASEVSIYLEDNDLVKSDEIDNVCLIVFKRNDCIVDDDPEVFNRIKNTVIYETEVRDMFTRHIVATDWYKDIQKEVESLFGLNLLVRYYTTTIGQLVTDYCKTSVKGQYYIDFTHMLLLLIGLFNPEKDLLRSLRLWCKTNLEGVRLSLQNYEVSLYNLRKILTSQYSENIKQNDNSLFEVDGIVINDFGVLTDLVLMELYQKEYHMYPMLIVRSIKDKVQVDRLVAIDGYQDTIHEEKDEQGYFSRAKML